MVDTLIEVIDYPMTLYDRPTILGLATIPVNENCVVCSNRSSDDRASPRDACPLTVTRMDNISDIESHVFLNTVFLSANCELSLSR